MQITYVIFNKSCVIMVEKENSYDYIVPQVYRGVKQSKRDSLCYQTCRFKSMRESL